MEQAFGLLFTLPGVPCLYYGDETGLTGGKDPENRAYFPWDNTDKALQDTVKKWYQWRKVHAWINEAEFSPFYLGDYGIGFTYRKDDHKILVVLNVSADFHKIQANDCMLDTVPCRLCCEVKKYLAGKTLEKSEIKISEDF